MDEGSEILEGPAYAAWLAQLEHEVIEGEFGYEPGEFTVYTSHWRALYDQGLTPLEAWRKALDGHRDARRDTVGDGTI